RALEACAAFGPDDGGVTGARREDESVAGSQREPAAVGEDEVDRASRAVQQLRVRVLVLAVAVAGAVRPAIHVTGLTPKRGLDRRGVRGTGVPVMLDVHVATISFARARWRRVPSARDRHGSRAHPPLRRGGRTPGLRPPRRVRSRPRCDARPPRRRPLLLRRALALPRAARALRMARRL